MAVGQLSSVMGELVAGARSSRDAAFNSLDAIERQTRAASAYLAQRVEKVIAENPAAPKNGARAEGDTHDDSRSHTPTPQPQRDARFDPEDEWEVPPPNPTPAVRSTSGATGDDDRGDYPQTWLR